MLNKFFVSWALEGFLFDYGWPEDQDHGVHIPVGDGAELVLCHIERGLAPPLVEVPVISAPADRRGFEVSHGQSP